MKQLTNANRIGIATGIVLLLTVSGVVDIVQLIIKPEPLTALKLVAVTAVIALELQAIKQLRGQHNGKKK